MCLQNHMVLIGVYYTLEITNHQTQQKGVNKHNQTHSEEVVLLSLITNPEEVSLLWENKQMSK